LSSLASWVAGRRPAPPEDLAAHLRVTEATAAGHAALAEMGRARLAEARARAGRVRESAFRLLEADALLTYACEAALENEDPEAALRGILASTTV
jgi:hypothetical protein